MADSAVVRRVVVHRGDEVVAELVVLPTTTEVLVRWTDQNVTLEWNE